MNLNLANAISALRIILTPVLFVLAFYKLNTELAIVLAIAFLTDMADGIAARALKQTNGVKIDSIADYILILSLPVIIYLTKPEAITENIVSIGTLIALFLIELSMGYIIQKQFVPLHHYTSKAANILIGIFAVYIIVYGFNNRFFLVVYAIMALSIIEDAAAYLAYKKPKFSKITVFYGLKKPVIHSAAIRMLTATGVLIGFSAYIFKLQALRIQFNVLSALLWVVIGLATGLFLGLIIRFRLRTSS